MAVAPQDAARRGRAVPSRVVPDHRGQGPARETSSRREVAREPARKSASWESREALARVVDRRDLSADEMAAVVGEIMDGEATPAQIGALLTALRMKGETVDEVVGAARAMRARMTAVEFAAETMVDTCGTGGDGSRSINVSTLAAFIVAACGRRRCQTRQPRAVVAVRRARRHRGAGAGPGARARAVGRAACARRSWRSCSRPRTTPPPTRGRAAQGAGLPHDLQPARAADQPGGVRVHVNGVFARERCELLARGARRARARGGRWSSTARAGSTSSRPRARRSSPSWRTAR